MFRKDGLVSPGKRRGRGRLVAVVAPRTGQPGAGVDVTVEVVGSLR
jgi:hypothetical protein